MPAEFENGIFLKEPAWHRLGHVVDEWPGSWEQARRLGGLEWEVALQPLTSPVIYQGFLYHADVQGQVMLVRDDKDLWTQGETGLAINKEAMLSIQPASYAVIRNEEFGRVIEGVVGAIGDDFAWETLLCLSGGKMIVALLKARNPLQIANDPSLNHTYLGFHSRHDGQGGLRVVPTNVREVCKNTHDLAEATSRRERVGWTIRHTENWSDRIGEMTSKIALAVKHGKAWEKLAVKLGSAKMIPSLRDRLIDSTFRTDSSMTDRQVASVAQRRDEVRNILKSPTCAGIEETLYGFVQAVDEWVDHVKPARNDETRFLRSWTRVDEAKFRALQLASAAADL